MPISNSIVFVQFVHKLILIELSSNQKHEKVEQLEIDFSV